MPQPENSQKASIHELDASQESESVDKKENKLNLDTSVTLQGSSVSTLETISNTLDTSVSLEVEKYRNTLLQKYKKDATISKMLRTEFHDKKSFLNQYRRKFSTNTVASVLKNHEQIHNLQFNAFLNYLEEETTDNIKIEKFNKNGVITHNDKMDFRLNAKVSDIITSLSELPSFVSFMEQGIDPIENLISEQRNIIRTGLATAKGNHNLLGNILHHTFLVDIDNELKSCTELINTINTISIEEIPTQREEDQRLKTNLLRDNFSISGLTFGGKLQELLSVHQEHLTLVKDLYFYLENLENKDILERRLDIKAHHNFLNNIQTIFDCIKDNKQTDLDIKNKLDEFIPKLSKNELIVCTSLITQIRAKQNSMQDIKNVLEKDIGNVDKLLAARGISLSQDYFTKILDSVEETLQLSEIKDSSKPKNQEIANKRQQKIKTALEALAKTSFFEEKLLKISTKLRKIYSLIGSNKIKIHSKKKSAFAKIKDSMGSFFKKIYYKLSKSQTKFAQYVLIHKSILEHESALRPTDNATNLANKRILFACYNTQPEFKYTEYRALINSKQNIINEISKNTLGGLLKKYQDITTKLNKHKQAKEKNLIRQTTTELQEVETVTAVYLFEMQTKFEQILVKKEKSVEDNKILNDIMRELNTAKNIVTVAVKQSQASHKFINLLDLFGGGLQQVQNKFSNYKQAANSKPQTRNPEKVDIGIDNSKRLNEQQKKSVCKKAQGKNKQRNLHTKKSNGRYDS